MNFREIVDKLLQKNWSPAKAQKLRELWKSCSDYYGFPQLTDVPKLRKLAGLINAFCDTKSSIPADVAEIVNVIKKEGLSDTAECEFGKPVYLGYVCDPNSDGFGGSFWFSCEVTKKFLMGYKLDENSYRQPEYQRKHGWGFFRLFLNGNTKDPYPQFKTEDELVQNWQKMKKGNKIIEGDPKKIKVA